MAAAVIGHIAVKDPEKWAMYRAQVPATIAPWGGELVLRGRRVECADGDNGFSDVVVLRFPDAAAAAGWQASPAYQALVPLRLEAADVLLVSYELTP